MIRPYTISDKENLIHIFNLNVPDYFHQTELSEFVSYLDVKAKTYCVIELNGEIIGGIGYEVRQSDRSGRINWMFLHPGFSGLGYGKEAALACISLLKTQQDVDVLIVRTSQFAFKFFEKLGYKLISQEKNYWAPGLDLYLMEQKNTDELPSRQYP